jgi:hypothetical protein
MRDITTQAGGRKVLYLSLLLKRVYKIVLSLLVLLITKLFFFTIPLFPSVVIVKGGLK